jgi:O-antigen ligase
VNRGFEKPLHLGGFDLILWVEKAGRVSNVTGTFVNRNNFATYVGLGILCLAGFHLWEFFRALQSGRTGRDRALHIVQQVFVRGAPQLACILILLTALFLTSSRAGVTSTLIALAVLASCMGALRSVQRRLFALLGAGLLGAALAVFLLSGQGWLDRLMTTDLDREARLQRYEQTWQAIGHAPLTGHGLGSFSQVFPLYADVKTFNSDKAHNDWLEAVFELGWPAALLWFAVLASLGLRCLVGFFRRGRDQVYPLVGFCACVLVGLHSLVDFSLQIPAVAVTFSALLGVGVAQSRSSRS